MVLYNFIKEIKDTIKNKKVIIILLLIMGIIALKKYAPTEYSVLKVAFILSKNWILKFWIPVIATIVIVAVLIVLLKLSDKKHWDEYKQSLLSPAFYENKDGKYISVKIYEKNNTNAGKYNLIRTISIKNTTEKTIEYINGEIAFFSDDTIIFTEKFDIRNLEPSTAVQFYNEEIEDKHNKWNWTSFRVYIDSISIEGIISRNIRQFGIVRLINFGMLLNSKYIRIYKYTFPYELTWFKFEVVYKIKACIRYYWGQNTYYRNKGLSFKKYIWWKIRQTIVLLIVGLILLLSILIIVIDLYFICNLIIIWYSFLNDSIHAIFT